MWPFRFRSTLSKILSKFLTRAGAVPADGAGAVPADGAGAIPADGTGAVPADGDTGGDAFGAVGFGAVAAGAGAGPPVDAAAEDGEVDAAPAPDPVVKETSSIAVSPKYCAHVFTRVAASQISPVLPTSDERSMSARCHLLPWPEVFFHSDVCFRGPSANMTSNVPIRGPNMWYWKLSHAPARKVVFVDFKTAKAPFLLFDASMYM